jgi:hypothetical protein
MGGCHVAFDFMGGCHVAFDFMGGCHVAYDFMGGCHVAFDFAFGASARLHLNQACIRISTSSSLFQFYQY